EPHEPLVCERHRVRSASGSCQSGPREVCQFLHSGSPDEESLRPSTQAPISFEWCRSRFQRPSLHPYRGTAHAWTGALARPGIGLKPLEAGCPPETSRAWKHYMIGHPSSIGDGGQDIFALKEWIILKD